MLYKGCTFFHYLLLLVNAYNDLEIGDLRTTIPISMYISEYICTCFPLILLK